LILLAQSPAILACVLVYLACCFGIGVWALRRTRDSADFFVAGRSLGMVVMTIATMASIMSGFGFVGGPGLVYDSGTSSLWITFPATVGFALSWVLLGKRLRLLAACREILTLPDVVAVRYGGRWPRFMMALALVLGVVGYLGTQILAVGVVLVAVLGVSLPVALLIGLGILGFYTVAGGILAGVYNDVFQGFIMMAASAAVLFYALRGAGGMSHISETLWAMDPAFIGPWGSRGPLAALSWYLLFGLGWMGQPHGITKFLMLKDPRRLRWGGLLTGMVYMVCSLLWMSIGLAMRTLVQKGAQPPLAQPDLAAPVFLMHYTPALVAGVVFAGLLAAIMSTANSFLNLGAAAVVRDIPIALTRRALARELFWSRVATVVLLVVSAVFALYMENLVALLGVFGWGTFAAAIVPPVCIGLNWKRATGAACVASIAVSLVLNFALELAARHKVYSLPYGLNVGCFALLVSLVVFIAVSWLTGRDEEGRLPPDVKAVMEI
jgi:sodium/proline symporter